MEHRQCSAVAIGARAAYFERIGVQKFDKPVARTKRQLSLGGTFCVQFRRIDIGDADFLAFKLDWVAIMDAMIARPGSTQSESGSKQKHSRNFVCVS